MLSDSGCPGQGSHVAAAPTGSQCQVELAPSPRDTVEESDGTPKVRPSSCTSTFSHVIVVTCCNYGSKYGVTIVPTMVMTCYDYGSNLV